MTQAEKGFLLNLQEAAKWTATLHDVRVSRGFERRSAAAAFRRAVIDILHVGDTAISFLARYLNEPRYAFVARRILMMIDTPASLDIFLDDALSEDLRRSGATLQGLTEFDTAQSSVPRLLDAYRDARHTHQREVFITLLLRSQGADAYDLAVEALHSSRDAGFREAVVRELSKYPDERAISLLSMALKDRSTHARLEALYGLVLRGDRERAGEIVRAFQQGSAAVRTHALDVLARLPLPEGMVPALEGLRDARVRVRNAALFTAGQLGDGGLFAPIIQLFNDANRNVRFQAEAVFAELTGAPLPLDLEEARKIASRTGDVIEPGTRYCRGKLWTLRAMVDSLMNAVLARYAHSNLVAATAQDFGFDPDRDMVTNVVAIGQWERWVAEHHTDFVPGGWYYQGRQIQ